jgi:hypothetical protein
MIKYVICAIIKDDKTIRNVESTTNVCSNEGDERGLGFLDF